MVDKHQKTAQLNKKETKILYTWSTGHYAFTVQLWANTDIVTRQQDDTHHSQWSSLRNDALYTAITLCLT